MSAIPMRHVAFSPTLASPVLGQGCWNIGDRKGARAAEIATLQRGIDLGLTLIDTAEMYGEGLSEQLVGEAIRGRRDDVTIVSKVYPQNAGPVAMRAACDRSLRRLGIERIDLYLLHWRGNIPLQETIDGFTRLKAAGKIATWGVSNFDVADLEALMVTGGEGCVTNQILYNLKRRGPEYDLLPWMAARSMPAMAYSPIEQGRLPQPPALKRVAEKYGATPMQIALAFVTRSGDVVAIPKASSVGHVEDNAGAEAIRLDDEDLAAIDEAFPRPKRKQPLAML